MVADLSTEKSSALAALQLSTGLVVLACAGWFYVLERTPPPTNFMGLMLFVILLAPVGLGLIISGLALKFRWPGWRMIQLVPWLTLPLTMLWLQ